MLNIQLLRVNTQPQQHNRSLLHFTLIHTHTHPLLMAQYPPTSGMWLNPQQQYEQQMRNFIAYQQAQQQGVKYPAYSLVYSTQPMGYSTQQPHPQQQSTIAYQQPQPTPPPNPPSYYLAVQQQLAPQQPQPYPNVTNSYLQPQSQAQSTQLPPTPPPPPLPMSMQQHITPVRPAPPVPTTTTISQQLSPPATTPVEALLAERDTLRVQLRTVTAERHVD